MKVFFSWQSDLKRTHYTNAIRSALQNAKSNESKKK